MSNTYTWVISSLDCLPKQDGNSDVVVTANWQVYATDGTYISNVFGQESFELQQGGSFTPYADLTEQQIVGWIQQKMGVDKVTKLQETLDQKINEYLCLKGQWQFLTVTFEDGLLSVYINAILTIQAPLTYNRKPNSSRILNYVKIKRNFGPH
jgi:hypothetical protein